MDSNSRLLKAVSIFLLSSISLICSDINAQIKIDKNYPYTYRVDKTDNPSFCYFQTENSEIKISEQEKYSFSIKCLNDKMEVLPFIALKLISSSNDTVLVISDINGLIKEEINLREQNSFILTTNTVGYTKLKTFIPMYEYERAKDIIVILGGSSVDERIILYSKRKLTQEEMVELIKDISNKNEDSELLKDKTCYWVVEI